MSFQEEITSSMIIANMPIFTVVISLILNSGLDTWSVFNKDVLKRSIVRWMHACMNRKNEETHGTKKSGKSLNTDGL